MKRHYTKGYYMHHSGAVNKTEATSSTKSQVEKMYPVTSSLMQDQNVPEMTASIKMKNEQKASKTYSEQIMRHVPAASPVIHKIKAPKLNVDTRVFASAEKEQRKGDANIVVMVILALFPLLCLIAVYLHDGGVTRNFWITLILHLTIVGAMIYALLVVLDVVDFA